MILSSALEQMGLNQKQSLVYLAALELGTDTVQNIAEKASIHRVTTYDILRELAQKGLVNKIVRGKKHYFVATEPEKILDTLQSKKELFTEMLPQLKAMQSKGKQKPKVMYFEGREAVWKAYLDRIRYMPELKENLVYGSSEQLQDTYPAEFKKFTKERLEKGIRTKIIVEPSPAGLWEASTAPEQLRQVKFLPEGIKFEANTVIYGDRVMTVSWGSMLCVIVEDKNNAANQRTLFDLLWRYLPSADTNKLP